MTISILSHLFEDKDFQYPVTLESTLTDMLAGLRPPERLSVSDAAAKYRKIKNVGSYEGDWLNETTPYLVEPMDVLTSDLYDTVCFVGPAQCGKTDMFLNYLAYTVKCDPMDLMLVQTKQSTARDFSISRVDRMHRHSPDIGSELISRRDADNTYDKHYKSGMLLRLSYPAVSELSGRPVPRLWGTDYDRMDQDVDGEGTPYELMKARTTTFGRHGMVCVESSPGFPVTDAHWIKTSRHQAPPVQGIFGIYNSGDRRRYYWRCVSCKIPFSPSWEHMKWPDSADPLESAEQAHMVCPTCHHKYFHTDTKDAPGKYEMNQLVSNGGHSRWLADGMTWRKDGTLEGAPRRSSVASFWLEGVNAAFASWASLVEAYLTADAKYRDTGEETSLKTVINTKLGLAYVPKNIESSRSAEELRNRAIDIGIRKVPYGVRFLLANIDVQKNRFVVQVHGIKDNADIVVIDRFEIKYSKRKQEDRPDQLAFVNPGTHREDWRQILTEVMLKTYPLLEDPSRHMSIKLTQCDWAGEEGVTEKAYDFYRWLGDGYAEAAKEEDKETWPWTGGMQTRFALSKGDKNINAVRIKRQFPDSQRKDAKAGARGEIPVHFLNVNTLKNHLDHRLNRTEAGGMVVFPDWLDIKFYKELTVESKDPKTMRWENPNKYRNESWDLLTYCLGMLLHEQIDYETIRWDSPPKWALDYDDGNELVFSIEEDQNPVMMEKKSEIDWGTLAEALG